MPELPDLQIFSRNLNKQVKGKRLKKVTVRNTKKLNVTEAELKKALEEQELTHVERSGKELHFTFNNGNVLGLHLMLRGSLYLFQKKNEHKYPIIELLFDDDTGLVLTDYQGQATLSLNPPEKKAIDALDKKLDADFLKKQLEKSRATIKNVLLDQHIIRGIGNAYADEILWDAGISPFSIAGKIPEARLKALAKSIKKVLQEAEKKIMKTHPDIITGEVRDFLNIHNAKKKHSPGGAAIHHKMVSSRKTYYTDEQEEYN